MTWNMKKHQHGPANSSAYFIASKNDGFQTCIFLFHLQLFNKLRFAHEVSQIVYLSWCIAHSRAWLLTIFLLRCSLGRVWVVQGEHHSSLVGIANPSRVQAGSQGARGTAHSLPPLHPKQLITFPRLSPPPCGLCSGAIMATHHHIHSPNEDCAVILTEPTWQV